MIKEISYQTDAAGELVEKTISLLNASGNRKKLVFKAPTGSGKTVIASRMLDELTTQLADEGREVALIWIAPNKLHQQSYLKMKNYFTETRVLRPMTYDELDHSAGGYIHPGEVFFVNWESINKDKNIMVRETESSASEHQSKGGDTYLGYPDNDARRDGDCFAGAGNQGGNDKGRHHHQPVGERPGKRTERKRIPVGTSLGQTRRNQGCLRTAGRAYQSAAADTVAQ